MATNIYPVVKIVRGRAVDFIAFGDPKSARHWARRHALDGWQRVGDTGSAKDPAWRGSVYAYTKTKDHGWMLQL